MFIGPISGLSIMFSSLGLFKQVDCPEGVSCSIPCCVFAHQKSSSNDGGRTAAPKPSHEFSDLEKENGPRKRRKISVPKGSTVGAVGPAEDGVSKPALSRTHIQPSEPLLNRSTIPNEESETVVESSLATKSRSISPPPLRGFKGNLKDPRPAPNAVRPQEQKNAEPRAAAPIKPVKSLVAESLNPRMLPNPPAAHNIRLKLVTMMHEQMIRLNEEVKASDDASKVALELSPQELIKAVLDEEEKLAKANPSIYTNVIKLRIGALKRMKLPVWKEERLKATEIELGKAAFVKPQAPKSIDTGLSPSGEIAVLQKLEAKQDDLPKHGYVTAQPSAAELDNARNGVEASQNWEQCDRCRTRFQVFPGRRTEDGALTTGGKCRYHWAKPRRPPPRDKADQGPRDSVYACCNETVGTSVGCTTADTHVFKISDPKRLALVMPFEETPTNPKLADKPSAVCFDCEMGYTTYGMELIRLTVTCWPSGSTILDTLVRPLGEILDLNSRFSGVWPSDFTSAALFFSPDRPRSTPTATATTPPPAPAFASSPAVARSQLFDLISTTTPLIGHALENDLNATRIIHPCIVDTCLLYPHPRGLPMRFGLKFLMKKHLDRDVQVAEGGKGHDSAEDARSAGDLVRLKVGEVWKGLKRDGWKIKHGELEPPAERDVSGR
ncbi:MAG: hypothetical protein Q9191_003421 [Dirinaria sp. TL-2023a]